MGQLTWKHHALIQALLSRGPLLEEEFLSIFKALTSKQPGSHQQLFNDYLRCINKELAYAQFELRGCRNQYDGNVYYGIINNIADEQSKLGTKYSVAQIAFYKAVIEAIVQEGSAQGSISSIEALNIRLDNQAGQVSQESPSCVPAAFRNFSLSQKEKTMHDLVRDKWLYRVSDGVIGLGIRSFLDLRAWFQCNGIPSCIVCNEAGIKAVLCSNENCSVRIHGYCLERKFSQMRAEKVCPGCSAAWPCSEFLAEEDIIKVSSQAGMHAGISTQTDKAGPSASDSQKSVRSCKGQVAAVEVDDCVNVLSYPHPAKRRRSCRQRQA